MEKINNCTSGTGRFYQKSPCWGFFVLCNLVNMCIIRIMRMHILFLSLICLFGINAAHAEFKSCGAGYVLTEVSKKIDGIPTFECEKLWCMDLETGEMMGNKDKPGRGYTATPSYDKICDSENNCVECWGARKWCAGQVRGEWNAKYGAYTRNGDDNNSFYSYLKQDCFAWHLEKPQCEEGMIAVMQDDEWICTKRANAAEIQRAATMRRSSAVKRVGAKR